MDSIIVIFLSAIIGLFAGMSAKPLRSLVISLIGLLAAALLFIYQGQYQSPFAKYNIVLNFGKDEVKFSLLCIALTFTVLLAGYNKVRKQKSNSADIMSLLLFSLCGALILIGFTDLPMFFLGLEILSIPLYVLAGSNKENLKSVEAAIKYFFTGSFFTCFLLLGIALIYGATGTFDLTAMQQLIEEGSYSRPMLFVGVFLIAASMLFKVGAVPFHFWGPDVYQGSPDNVTAFMASVVKIAMLFTFYKFFSTIFSNLFSFWSGLVYVAIVLSLFIGYLGALKQQYYKRLIAYSSITHSAFALFALLNIQNGAASDLFIFTVGYGFSVVALITVSMAGLNEEDKISDLKGIGRKYPIVGMLFIFALLSLTGIPPFTGFFGKTLLFYNVFTAYPLLVLFGLISTAIGGYFYLNLIFASFSSESDGHKVILKPIHQMVLLLCAFFILTGWLLMLFQV
jgi:NADH-quinone oxidoreductase subunit N